MTVAGLETVLDALAAGSDLPDEFPQRIAQALPFLTVIGVAVPFDGNFQAASAMATARLRRKQLSRLSLDVGAPPSTTAHRPCEIDGIRPAAVSIRKGDDNIEVSESVAARRRIGIQSRSGIYGHELADTVADLQFADSFVELIEHSPAGLPPSLAGKMAVVRLDGNQFTRVRDAWIARDADSLQAAASFSQKVIVARRQFLAGILAMAKDDTRMRTPGNKLRLETLMWGGDESLFVIPAWKVRDLLDVIAQDMVGDHWTLAPGLRLTTSFAILVCSVKTPIAIASRLAESMLSGSKRLNDTGTVEDRLSLQVIESIEAPAGDVDGLRKQLHNTDAPQAYTISGGSGLRRYIDICDRITDPQSGLPRSQLQGILARGRNGMALVASGDPPVHPVDDAVRRSRAEQAGERKVGIEALIADLRDPILGAAAGFDYLPYQRLAELWDVLRPFGHIAAVEAA
ncbi:hypothetical protein [Rhizobium sp. CECT 9324]|uniref:hypothetical protein n=1 Tax=Rhizobium sp. CECT 9324 TaxID=2845820 RepID=UPI001E31A6DC|nr:hypothetical protein [Rhizobium sp. CECT 9324]CAH0343038.1 hypothetical protein RHI9324_04771 [Rhizobium sp. CECT 9324]